MNSLVRVGLLVALVSTPRIVLGVELSLPMFIEGVSVRDELGVVRLEVPPVLLPLPRNNPADCADRRHVDIRLDVENRSATEQRELLNLIQLAFVLRRQVSFYFLDSTDPEPCSTVATTESIRVAVGVQFVQ